MFVPHQKGSVDMVVVVDGSGSMDLEDYLGRDGRPSSRLEGVKKALEVLVERRLRSITRVSKIAFVVFGSNSRVFFPHQSSDMTELNHEITRMELLDDIRKINDVSLRRLGVDRNGTNISQAIEYAADMLNYHSYEGNEKTILLLSDGADWKENNDYSSLGEPMPTANDPATLADDLYYVSEIRIHTIAISDEQALNRFSPQHRGQVGAVPNPKLLKLIAENSHARVFANPDATVLADLFDELGEGMIYPI
jgi:Mg-chelatase subunit ChlD